MKFCFILCMAQAWIVSAHFSRATHLQILGEIHPQPILSHFIADQAIPFSVDRTAACTPQGRSDFCYYSVAKSIPILSLLKKLKYLRVIFF